ncbi:MAG: hypothetical protein LBB82_08885, partial [Treponema sp.]|nr:hypothetical protein [Treponema sp.]
MKMGGIKGALALSVFVLCGLVLTGVDNCEGDHVTAPGTDAAASNAASDTAAETDAAKVSGISGKEWKLTGLRKGDAIITIDRNKLRSEGFGDFFTFNIDGRRISGKAA